MNRLIQTLKNIWGIKELRTRILFTLALIGVYRLGNHIVLPGVRVVESQEDVKGLLGLINAFSGGGFNNVAIFALGIMPYITASIFIQLLTFAVPYFQKMQKEGESGTRKLNQITRILTIAVTLVQGAAYLTYIRSLPNVEITAAYGGVFYFTNIMLLVAGTIFCMWLGERITDKGIGNGTSLLIMMGIVARLPEAFFGELEMRFGKGGGFIFVLEIALFIMVVVGAILLIQGVRKIPLQYAKRMVGRAGGATVGPVVGNRDYLPVKVNASGVMPIIFAQALMFLPTTIIGALNPNSNLAVVLGDYKSLPHNILFFLLILIFTYVYTALIVNPNQYAEFLKRQNAFIPGVKPGKSTADFIDSVTSRITLPGAIALAILAILPGVVGAVMGTNDAFALFFGGSSLLILVGVGLDTLQQIEGHLLNRQYDGLVKGTKIQGRTGKTTIGAQY